MTTVRDMPQELLERILSAGILAPSADNHHLLQFSILPDRIVVRVSDGYRAANAQTRLLAWIAYGAVVENMLVAASAAGWAGRLSWFPSEDAACEISLVPLAGVPDGLAAAIPGRRTNRRLFSGPKLKPAQQADLESEIAKVEGVRLVWLDDPEARRRVLRLMRIAESERFRVRSLHLELFSSLRFDVGFKSSCAQGIPAGAAELEVAVRPVFGLIRHWPVMRLLNVIGAYWFIGWRAAYVPARLSPHLGVVLADGDIRSAALKAGRGLERVWLRASQMGLELQPMVAAPMYALSQFEAVTDAVREELREGWKTLVPGGRPLMLFRLGHARAPSVRAGRPPLSDFLPAAGP